MVIKNLSRVLLMLVAVLFSYQVSAASKYPACDFQPKIVYQSEETQLISHPPKALSSSPPIAQLIIVLLIAGLGAYVYKNKYQKPEAAVKTITVRSSSEREPEAAKTEPPARRETSDGVQIKRINKNYKGYRSKGLS